MTRHGKSFQENVLNAGINIKLIYCIKEKVNLNQSVALNAKPNIKLMSRLL